MKTTIIFISSLFLLGLSFLVFKTFTVNKVCGWKGQGITMKDWRCLCLGINRVSIEPSMLTSPEGNIEIFYCTGLNLSCSQFVLKNFYSGDLQKPIYCDTSYLTK